MAFSQPQNDDCGGIIDLGEAPICPISDTFTNVAASQSNVFTNPSLNIPQCFTGGVIDRDVWFSFSVPASGNFVDFTVQVAGIDGINGSIIQPQVAIYRGECIIDELQELDCVTSLTGSNEVELDLLGLTPGLSYFIRISDWSSSATPNWGDFTLCVKEYDPVFNIGETSFSESCNGTLFDSGGPDSDYSDGENLTMTVCPQDFFECMNIELAQFSIESPFDHLYIYAGDNTSAPLIADINGFGSNINLQTSSSCITFQFTSDGSVTDSGFELNWSCSPVACSNTQPVTCDNPFVITDLPYNLGGLTTCNAGNEITNAGCNDGGWLETEDFIFMYESPGQECVTINVSNSNIGTGVAIFDDCPISGECLAQSGGSLGTSDPSINSVFLEDPGTYYIVVDNAAFCTEFDFEIFNSDCPVVLPSAALCEDALSINGCSEDLPAIVSVAPGQGDPTFIQAGVNEGCWGGIIDYNYTFFFFQAQENGDFGFTIESADPNEASDVDFIVWGPINDVDELCDFASMNQPIRSSYADGEDPTGLADIHPILGTPVDDTCEDALGDDFVSAIDVLEGEYYVILINDFDGLISSGAISIDFGVTSPGVLAPVADDFSISPDTVLCPGESVQLLAEGGEIYHWFPSDGLSCSFCPNPIATISESMTYQVAINSVCQVDTLSVNVGQLEVHAGADQTVCLGEEIQIVAGANFENITYNWTGPTNFLSCIDCPDPFITASSPGTFEIIISAAITNCADTDTMMLTVLPNEAPMFEVNDDQSICIGETVALGGATNPGITYNWTSDPPGFSSVDANPVVTPANTTTYYLEATNNDCPLSAFDSIHIEVSAIPIIEVAGDMIICQGESVQIGATIEEQDVVYQWSPILGLDNPNQANPVATPSQSIQYTLVATRNGCSISESVEIEVTPIDIVISGNDTTGICLNESIDLMANAVPAGTTITWTPNDGSLNINTGGIVTAAPQTTTMYFAEVQVPGCTKLDSVLVMVDSLPQNLQITPVDTQICMGQQVLLTSPIYEPANFGDIIFEWFPQTGQLTPDSLYNMVVVPPESTVYQRIISNGFCRDTSEANITVIEVTSISIEPENPVICQNETVVLLVVAPPEVTNFTWSPAVGLSCTDCPNPTASPPVTTTYTLEGEFDGCPVGTSVSIEVVPDPQISFPDPPVVCPGESITLNNFADPNASYEWVASDGTLVTNDPQPIVSPTVTTTYTVTATRGDCTIEESVTIFVAENFEFSIDQVETICPGEEVILMANTIAPNVIFTWTDGTNSWEGATINISPASTTTYTVTASDEGMCFSNIDVITVEVSPDFEVTAFASPAQILAGETAVLSAEATVAGIDFIWFNANQEEIGSGPTISVISCNTETYTVTGTDFIGCEKSDTVTVSVDQGFSIGELNLINLDTLEGYYEGEEVRIEAITSPNPILGATYIWSVNGLEIATTSDTTSGNFFLPEIIGDAEDIDIGLKVVVEAGCETETSATFIIENNPVAMPNVFTPNGDGTNDFFSLISLVPVNVISFQVWDRWGKMIFNNENEDGWDGRYQNKDALSDVYVYRIIYEIQGANNPMPALTGNVTLLR